MKLLNPLLIISDMEKKNVRKRKNIIAVTTAVNIFNPEGFFIKCPFFCF